MQYIRSPMNYTGGKYKILDSIIPLFKDDTDKFVDLFAGGMNVSINTSANTIYVNDRVTYIIELYKYFRDIETGSLIYEIERRIKLNNLSSTNKSAYIAFRDHYNETKDILDLFILTCFSFNHQIRYNNSHEFNATFGLRSWNDDIKYNLIQFCRALRSKNIIFSSLDFRDFDFSILSSGDVVYCDPPYLISAATYNDGNRGFGGWSEKDDSDLFQLLDSFNEKGILFALSDVTEHRGLTNQNLIDFSERYNTIYIDKQYSDCSYNLKDRYSKTIEVLITNIDSNNIIIKPFHKKLF